MKRKNLALIILTLLLTSSCGLMDQSKTADETNPTDDTMPEVVSSEEEVSVAADTPEMATNAEDELYSRTLSEFSEPASEAVAAPAPEVAHTPAPEVAPVTTHVEVMPEIRNEVVASSGPKNIKFYRVKKGETLMQIAFKLYGDISRWKDLKHMNQEKVSRNAALPTDMSLKYEAPDTEFVWNPVGSPYLIKDGETLGTISNTVYQTPKKWKNIWENNKPLIKNPNVIYAGFTLYYRDEGLANYVQPKKHNKVVKVQPVVAPVEKIDVAEELLKRDVADKPEASAAMDMATEETTIQ